MIDSILIKGLKTFRTKYVFDFAKINLLTGVNGKGKSTLLQTILLVNQTIEHKYYGLSDNVLVLNGKCVNLGTFDDIRNRYLSPTDKILIGFGLDKRNNAVFELSENPEEDMIANFNYKTQPETQSLDTIFEIFRGVHFIAADREGPKDYYQKTIFKDFIHVGHKGEFVANALLKLKRRIEPHLVHNNLVIELENEIDTPLDVETQVNRWMSYIFELSDFQVVVEDVGNNLVILKYKFDKSDDREYKPANVGFGYTYLLPIIVSGLIATKGQILIVENPEAHIHPGVQSRLMNFLCKVANTDIQVFVESHSDHILNGLLVNAKKSVRREEDATISNEDIRILHFDRNREDESIINPVTINENAVIQHPPNNFFDQIRKDRRYLMGF